MRTDENVRVNWGVLRDTTEKIKEIKGLLFYGSDGDVVDRAVAELHARIFAAAAQQPHQGPIESVNVFTNHQ